MPVMLESSMKEAAEDISKGKYYGAFMVKHPGHNTMEETKRLKVAIEVLEAIQKIHKANHLLEEMGNDSRIDEGIFHIVMDKVLNPYTKFTEEHRKRFYLESKKLEELRQTISKFSHMDFYFSNEVEFMVLGTSVDEAKYLRNILGDESFDDIYFHHYIYFVRGYMDYDAFIASMNKWMEMTRLSREEREVV